MGIHLINDYFSNVTLTERFSLRYLSYQFWIDVGDPRVSDYFIVKSGPMLTLAIISLYLFFSLYLGPKIMANRRPFKLRGIIFCYNIVMVFLNLHYLIYVLGILDYGIGLFVHKITKREDLSGEEMFIIAQGHGLFVTKFIDLLDTIFFVVRKKNSHISFLHLYHHSAVPILYWLGFRLLPTMRPLCIFVLVNCSIHVLMYTYYALSSLGPQIRRYLWWKRYITQIQMIQFIIYAVYAVYCSQVIEGIPLYLQIFVHIQSPIFLVLFGHFYIKAYIYNKKKCTEEKRNSIEKQNNTNGITVKNDKNNNIRYLNTNIVKNGIKCD